MEFSARLVLSSNSGYSKKRVSFFHSASVYWQALLSALEGNATDCAASKGAILRFSADVDCRSDYLADRADGPAVLGDGDFAALYIDSLDRRGKTAIAPMLLQRAMSNRMFAFALQVNGICEEMSLIAPVQVRATDADGQKFWSFDFAPASDSIRVPEVAPRLPITLRLKDSNGTRVERQITDLTIKLESLKRFHQRSQGSTGLELPGALMSNDHGRT
jgi:hypothetical protein